MYVYKLAREERENHQAWKKCKWKSQVIEIAIWIFNTRNQKKNPFLSSGKKAPFSSFFLDLNEKCEKKWIQPRWWWCWWGGNEWMTDWLIIMIIMIGEEKEGKVERSRLKTFFFTTTTTTTNMSYIKQSYGNWIEKLNWQCHHQLSWYTLGISF